MSVATEIQRIKTAIANAYTAVSGKGGTVPQSAVVGNLATAIGTISTGTPLPTLTTPAAAGDILSGKEAIDGDGDKLTGSLVIADTLSLAEDPTVTNGVLSVEVESSKETGTKTFTVSVPDAIPENIVAGKEILGVEGSAKKLTRTTGQYTVASEGRSFIGLSGLAFPMAVYISSSLSDAAALAAQKNKPVVQQIRALPFGGVSAFSTLIIVTPAGVQTDGNCLCYCESTRTRFYLELGGEVYTEAIFPSGLTYSWEAYHWQGGEAV